MVRPQPGAAVSNGDRHPGIQPWLPLDSHPLRTGQPPGPGHHIDMRQGGLTAGQLEKKKQEYEMIREQKRRFEAEMQKHEQELAQMTEDLRGPFGGHQSEPTTPPEYRETSSGFPSIFSRPNRYSTSSLASPPGLLNRVGRSGSQISSPPAGILASIQPPWSTPATRRNSDPDDKEEAVRQDPTSHRSSNA